MNPLHFLAPLVLASMVDLMPRYDVDESHAPRRRNPHGTSGRSFSYKKWQKKANRRRIAEASRRRNRRK